VAMISHPRIPAARFNKDLGRCFRFGL